MKGKVGRPQLFGFENFLVYKTIGEMINTDIALLVNYLSESII